MRDRIAVATILLLVLTPAAPTFGTVVYDSLPFTDGGMGINVVGTTGNETGQSIILSGGAWQITEIDVAIGASSAGGFQIRFYELNGTGGKPGSLIWQSPTKTYPYESPFYNDKVISVDVPAVTVPSTFAWVVGSVEPAGNMLVISSNPPTVGQNLDLWYRPSGNDWGKYNWLNNTGVFGARLFAVPEPTTAALLVVAGAATCCLRKRH